MEPFKSTSTPDLAGRRGPVWLVTAVALAAVLWLEADVPGLPPLDQSLDLKRALGDPASGSAFSGLLSGVSAREVALRLGVTAALFLVAWLVARLSPSFVRRLVRSASVRIESLPTRTFGIALFLAAAGAAILWFVGVRGLTPRLGDETAYLFQARLFSEGRLWMPSPEFEEFFKVTIADRGSRWFSHYPPGHTLLLTPWLILGLPWLLNPLAGAAAAVATWRLGSRLYDERTGRIAGALALISPYFLFQSASYFSHATCLAALAFATLGLLRPAPGRGSTVPDPGRAGVSPGEIELRDTGSGPTQRPQADIGASLSSRIPSWLAPVSSGLLIGLAAINRPLTVLGVAPAILLIALAHELEGGSSEPDGTRERLGHRLRGFGGRLLPCLVAAGLVCAIVPFYNQATTGSAWLWGYQAGGRTSQLLGFGERGELDVVFTPARAVFNTRVRWRWLDGGFETGSGPIPGGGLFNWPIPWIVFAFFLLPRRAGRRMDLAVSSVPVFLLLVHFPYHFLDYCWGPQFLYESAFAVWLLIARGAIVMSSAWGRGIPQPRSSRISMEGDSSGDDSTFRLYSGTRDVSGGQGGPGRWLPAGRVGGAGVVTAAIALCTLCGALGAARLGEQLYDPVTWPTRRVDLALTESLRAAGIEQGTVFMQAGAFYETGWRRNFVEGESEILFSKDLGAFNRTLLEARGGPGWIAAFNGDASRPDFEIRTIDGDLVRTNEGSDRMGTGDADSVTDTRGPASSDTGVSPVAVATSPQSLSVQEMPPPHRRLRIGATLSLTGANSYWSNQIHKGLEVAVVEANRDPALPAVDLIVADNMGKPGLALATFDEWVSADSVSVVVTCSRDIAQRLRSSATQARIPLIATGVQARDFAVTSTWVFLDFLSQDSQIVALAEFGYDSLGLRRVATLVSDNGAGRAAGGVFATTFSSLGGEVAAALSIDARGDGAPNAAAAIATSGADGVLLVMREQTLPAVVTALRSAGFRGEILGPGSFDLPATRDELGQHLDGVVYSSMFTARDNHGEGSVFGRAYRSRFGNDEPDWLAVQGYTMGRYLVDLLRRTGGNSERIRDGLAGLDVDSIRGRLTMSETREVVSPVGIYRYEQGEGRLLQRLDHGGQKNVVRRADG